jgi:hypothetical protein
VYAVVVLVRGDDDDTAFGGANEGVAVMVVDPAVSWSELAAVIYGLERLINTAGPATGPGFALCGAACLSNRFGVIAAV